PRRSIRSGTWARARQPSLRRTSWRRASRSSSWSIEDDLSVFRPRRHAPLPAEGYLPGFAGATGWLNSPPLTVDDLRGKVVLVEFWTYTCINWLRTLAYVRAWSDAYRDRGLVVVGVHTPEFPFEQNVDNVRQAAEELNVRYPIALDSDYEVWRAFG